MTLPYSLMINDERSYFPEKIITSIYYTEGYLSKEISFTEIDNYMESKYYDEFVFVECSPKLHTIREDSKNRWKAGNDIHFVINNRTKYRLQFMPVLKCISTQSIVISYDEDQCEKDCMEPSIRIDGRLLKLHEVESLAVNDGFNTVEDFFKYFNSDFTGKIIHWTKMKY